MKRITVNRRILAFILCITVIYTGMYVSKVDIDSSFSCSNMEYTMSSSYRRFNKTDAASELFERETDEITAESLSGANGRLSVKINSFKYLYTTAVQPYIPIITWTILMILMQKVFADRMYLILFIHNKDGKK